MSVRAQPYDLVLNNWELGSAGRPIQRGDIQPKVVVALGIRPKRTSRALGAPARRLRLRRPPHGGFAVGLDRLIAILAREVTCPS